jgi:hypothetical protein
MGDQKIVLSSKFGQKFTHTVQYILKSLTTRYPITHNVVYPGINLGWIDVRP